MVDNFTHYTVDGSLMRLREMRQIVDVVLGYGDSAYHLSVQDIVRILQKDNRKVEVFKPHF
jgi:hypothetical protein